MEGEKRKGKKYKNIRLLSSLQVSFHDFPITNSNSFPDAKSFSICNTAFSLYWDEPSFQIIVTPGWPGQSSFVSPDQSHTSFPALRKSPTIEELFASEIWFFSLSLHTPRPHSHPPSVHFYFSPLFINMSTLLLDIKGFLRNSFPHICLGVIWMFRMEIKRHKNRFC